MRLIRQIKIENFRSYKKLTSIGQLEDFTALVGLNNSGKSNLLRALNLFFYNEPEPGVKLNFSSDFHFVVGKKKKVMTVSVSFDLPSNFKFPKSISKAEDLLTRSFELKKTWTLETFERPAVSLKKENEREYKVLDERERETAEQFLALIHYRYIPSHVHPYSMVREESEGLKEFFLRRLTHKGKGKSAEVQRIFSDLNKISNRAINPLSQLVRQTSQEIKNITLATPQSLGDLLFSFSLEIELRKGRLKSNLMGSGVQSQLMYLLLYLIDTSYRQRFGWRQATIWAIEEPESSMHSTLEAVMASFFKDITTSQDNRIQIFCTTHSDMFAQYSSSGIFFELDAEKGTTETSQYEPIELIKVSSQQGVSRYSHPLLYYPLQTLILMEGKTDKIIIEKALSILGNYSHYRVESLSSITEDEEHGGLNHVIKYIEDNRSLLDSRMRKYPAVVVLEWSCKEGEFHRLKKLETGKNGLVVIKMSKDSSNPRLSDDFKGIEKFLSVNLIEKGRSRGLFKLWHSSDGNLLGIQDHEEFNKSKSKFAELVAKEGLENDFQFLKTFIQELENALTIAQQKLGI